MARFAFMRVGGNEWDYFLAGKINCLKCLLVDQQLRGDGKTLANTQ